MPLYSAGLLRGKMIENDNKLRIAMFGQKHIPSREGGVEIVVEELSTRMAALGHDVTCFCRRGHHVSGKAYDSKEFTEYKGVHIKSVPTVQKRGLAALSSSFFAAEKAAHGNFDVVHIHAEGPAFFSYIPKRAGKKVIVTIHGLDWQRAKWNNGIGAKFILEGEKKAVKYADEIIVLSKAVQMYFKDKYNRSTVYIPNGISKPKLVQAELITTKFDLKKDQYILFLGRLVPEKGLRYLIEAFKHVKTDKKLVIAGGSSDTNGFEQEIRDMAANDNRILFTGFVKGKLLEELYSNAYLYTLPSDLEGMPLSLLEAMSYGNCCLVSNIPECAEVIENHGVMFKKSDVTDLKDKLQMLCDNQNIVKKYKTSASDYICNKYNWDEIVKKTLELY